MKILLIEDDQTTAQFTAKALREEGHSVDVLEDGQDGLLHAISGEFDALIVDRLLPGLDGMSIVKALRSMSDFTPIIIVSALNGVDDKIDGLNAGADDYLVKPFAFGELSARLMALSRRPQIMEVETSLSVDNVVMDLVGRKVTRGTSRINLMPREFSLLELLLKRKGRVQTKTMLLESIWEINFDPQTNVVETHISRLRAKLNTPGNKELIQTIRGCGYMIEG